MRRIVSIAIVIAVLAACQRGDEDPVISVIPRKSRLAGTWTVNTFDGLDGVLKYEYDGTKMTYTTSDTLVEIHEFSWTMKFDRDGQFVITTVEEVPEDTLLKEPPYTRTIVENGDWEFTGGNSTPAKSQLLLMTTKIETTRSNQGSNVSVVNTENPNSGFVYDIKGLSTKELILTYDQIVSTAFGQEVERGEIKLSKD